MLYRPPKGTQQASKSKRKRPLVRLEVRDAFEFLAKLKPGTVDLIVSSPPYCMGKEYDTSVNVDDFVADHEKLAPLLIRALKDGGSLCWQIGHHVRNGVTIPLDAIVYSIFAKHEELLLRNRIVWTFGHGVHASRRFSGRHETILWFTKGHDYEFNLDAVRVPQKYPGKRHYKGPRKGKFSGNPLGKNPSDVWEIPNVKSRHVEKTNHPCQFPVALALRLIKALTEQNDMVIDPFMGSASSGVAAMIAGREFAGCDINPSYVAIARARITAVRRREGKYRPLERPIHQPNRREAVAKKPVHFS